MISIYLSVKYFILNIVNGLLLKGAPYFFKDVPICLIRVISKVKLNEKSKKKTSTKSNAEK